MSIDDVREHLLPFHPSRLPDPEACHANEGSAEWQKLIKVHDQLLDCAKTAYYREMQDRPEMGLRRDLGIVVAGFTVSLITDTWCAFVDEYLETLDG